MTRASTTHRKEKDVDGRVKPGHDAVTVNAHKSNRLMRRRPQSRQPGFAEIRRRLPSQRRQHKRHHMREALVPRRLLQEIAAEDHGERGAVRQIEEAQPRDRNVELDRIDGDAEVAAFDTAATSDGMRIDPAGKRAPGRPSSARVSPAGPSTSKKSARDATGSAPRPRTMSRNSARAPLAAKLAVLQETRRRSK